MRCAGSTRRGWRPCTRRTRSPSPGTDASVAQARAELGYVDYLRAHYDRAERWLTEAVELSEASSTAPRRPPTSGLVATDRSDDTRARRCSARRSRCRAPPETTVARRTAWPCWAGSPCCAATSPAAEPARRVDRAGRERALARVPALPAGAAGRGAAARGRRGGAEMLQQAFARACQLADPCWEGLSARAGPGRRRRRRRRKAFALLADARAAATGCRTGTPGWTATSWTPSAAWPKHGHPQTQEWVDALRDLASRTGMRGLVLRSLEHGAALGNSGERAAGHCSLPTSTAPSWRRLWHRSPRADLVAG